MSKTVAQVVESAARKLGLIGRGQTLESDFNTDLTNAYNEVHSEWESRNAISWGPAAAVPDQYANAMATFTAMKRALEYKMPAERLVQLQAENEMARRTFWAMRARPKMGSTEIENF